MRYSRQNKILELITNQEIETQEKLAFLLKEAGYDVTQATVSRDIKDLQLVKVQTASGKYKYSQTLSNEDAFTERYHSILKNTVVSYAAVNNMIVLNTMPNCASAVAGAIDTLRFIHVVGTIAGNNGTVLIIVDDPSNTGIVTKAMGLDN